MKQVIGLTLAVSLTILASGVILSFSTHTEKSVLSLTDEGLPEYYLSTGCPECTQIDNALDRWSIPVKRYNVTEDRSAQTLLSQRTRVCFGDTYDIHVPLIYTQSGMCVRGASEILSYLKNYSK